MSEGLWPNAYRRLVLASSEVRVTELAWRRGRFRR